MHWDSLPAPAQHLVCRSLTLWEAARFACTSRSCRTASRARLTLDQARLASLLTLGEPSVISQAQLLFLWRVLWALVARGQLLHLPKGGDPLHESVYSLEMSVGDDGLATEVGTGSTDCQGSTNPGGNTLLVRATRVEGSSREIVIEHPHGVSLTATWEPHVDPFSCEFRGFVTLETVCRSACGTADWAKALLLAVSEAARSCFPSGSRCSPGSRGTCVSGTFEHPSTCKEPRAALPGHQVASSMQKSSPSRLTRIGRLPRDVHVEPPGPECTASPTCLEEEEVSTHHQTPTWDGSREKGQLGGGCAVEVTRPGVVQILVDTGTEEPRIWAEHFAVCDAVTVTAAMGERKRLTREESTKAGRLPGDRALVLVSLMGPVPCKRD